MWDVGSTNTNSWVILVLCILVAVYWVGMVGSVYTYLIDGIMAVTLPERGRRGLHSQILDGRALQDNGLMIDQVRRGE